jgi:putative RecB family exonuclease
MVIYSHSKISTFEQCPLKFKYRYIDKIIPEIEKTIEAHLGEIVHMTLEWLYNTVKEKKIAPELDEVIDYYSEKWQELYSDKIVIVKKEFSPESYFEKGVNFLLNYYYKHKPFNDGTIECEKKVFINLDPETKIQGIIDRLVYNKETEEYEIHDYKTANSIPSKQKFETDRQLALYSIAIKEMFGKEKKVCLVWHYLAYNQKICVRKTEEQLEQLKKDTLKSIKQIESAKEFPSNKSILCNWCEYKNSCEEFNKR